MLQTMVFWRHHVYAMDADDLFQVNISFYIFKLLLFIIVRVIGV